MKNKSNKLVLKKCQLCKQMPKTYIVKTVPGTPKPNRYSYCKIKCVCSSLVSPEINTTFNDMVKIWNKGFRNLNVG